MNSKQYCDFLSYVHRNSTNNRFCSKSERLIFNDLAKIYQKFLPNAKFGPKELCVFACICVGGGGRGEGGEEEEEEEDDLYLTWFHNM